MSNTHTVCPLLTFVTSVWPNVALTSAKFRHVARSVILYHSRNGAAATGHCSLNSLKARQLRIRNVPILGTKRAIRQEAKLDLSKSCRPSQISERATERKLA